MNPPTAARGGVRLAGTGIAIPPRVVTNSDLAKVVDTDDAWIVQRTGIKQRNLVDENQGTKELAVEALRVALDRANLPASELDLVIVATMTPEMCCPSTAARVTAELGGNPAGAIDISAACAGFVYGLNFAYSSIKTGMYRNVAVVGAEALSQIVDWKDRRTCVLFGDGAGAVVLSACEDESKGCLFQKMGSNGNQWKDLFVPRKDEDLPPDDQAFSGAFNTLQMNGREVYKFAVTTLQNSIEEAVKAVGITPNDLTVVVPHQSNARILESVRDRVGLSEDKLYINIDRYGNTSAASVPICLHELSEAGRINDGDLVLFVGLGGGTTWSSSLWRV